MMFEKQPDNFKQKLEVAGCFLEDLSGRFLVLLRNGNKPQGNTWGIPSGKVEDNEKLEDCILRELSEETGLKSNKWTHLISVHPAIGYTNEVIECFVAEELEQSEQHLDQGEFLQVQKIPVPHLLQMIQKGEMKDSKSVHALLYFANFYLSGSTKI